tara:strand:- start:222 stop:392 length:171 start_codon:yes stop_codon:yes gene_type:complete
MPNPALLAKTMLTYTEEAIEEKVQGVVIIQGIIRCNARVDGFRILRSLGFGLKVQP